MKWLSRKEELVLLAIWRLQGNAYGVTIREHVIEATGKYWSIGAIYDVLERLGRKRYVSTIAGDPVPERGGRSKRFYRLTRDGLRALEEVRGIQETMWADLPDPATE